MCRFSAVAKVGVPMGLLGSLSYKGYPYADDPYLYIQSGYFRSEEIYLFPNIARMASCLNFKDVSALKCAIISCIALLFAISSTDFTRAQELKDYKLGPQDKIEIKVFDLRTGSGEAHKWTAFEGDVAVDANGQISLPIVGQMSVAGMTVGEVGSLISTKMQKRVGLTELPSTAVQVVKYRPFYIAGAVEKPGEYDYRPNMTVLQAISIAGGLYRLTEAAQLALNRDAQVIRGDSRVLANEKIGLQARAYRLQAEIADLDAVKFKEINANSAPESDTLEAQNIETKLFLSRKTSLQAQIKNIEDTNKSLIAEIDALRAKSLSTDRQIDMLEKDLNQARELVSKGLATSTRQLSAEQTVSSFENSKLDIRVAILRALQEQSKLGREIVELRARRQQDAMLELAQVRSKLLENEEKSKTSGSLALTIEDTRSMYAAPGGGNTYILSRLSDGGYRTQEVPESFVLEPGDVLQVRRRGNTSVLGSFTQK